MKDATTLVNGYLAAWNETDPGRRRGFVDDTFCDDSDYLDPMVSGAGLDGIDAMIADVQKQFPGHRFTLTEGPDRHHDRLRFAWSLAAESGQTVAQGVDFVTLAEDGRMRSVTGFVELAG